MLFFYYYAIFTNGDSEKLSNLSKVTQQGSQEDEISLNLKSMPILMSDYAILYHQRIAVMSQILLIPS